MPASRDISEYGMNPNTLSELCCTRWLSSDHMLQICSILNSCQNHTKVIYFNFMGNLEYLLSKITVVPEKLIFILNVGGNSEKTFTGSDNNPGCHWTLGVYNNIDANFYYGDSLGWSAPDDFLFKLDLFIKKLYHVSTSFNIVYCHDATTHQYGGKVCSSLCRKNYPLQTCGNICGVIAIIVCGISCLRYDYFMYIISTDKPHNNNYIFLQEPTKYSKYLRYVLMSWFISKEVVLDFVIPKTILFESGSNNSEDVVCTNVLETKVNKNLNNITKEIGFQSLKCTICNISFTVKSNMQRHIKNKHKSTSEGQIFTYSGNCFCLQCGFQCRRINDLRKHLSVSHSLHFKKKHCHLQIFQNLKYGNLMLK
nr:uncharacterized protein LOC105849511 [Hydra vulgaris]XP_047122625.1 uncharacterized protein LOC105849511 [Hydra vulgaris]XP_047122631.1 uncharacterized protein LOC105849511 [Hydra vulgaris]XP_047122636.1 uncharacterized protein LOC105849511 [Hydra vulgaris]XP_047122643.1 uncharacterized protein LOC105849511 [Hydra vulgaris]XP_047122652.1 uncharacterized protein LOC105849511 [Hydra vulgaris]XP_047122660.1 uncharacterized protein LOC105849511 [Hydra vulgaris]XP_047122664.1 uncharacterized p